MLRKRLALLFAFGIALLAWATTSLVHAGESTTAAERSAIPSPRPLVSGDRIVLLGDGFIERMQNHGYFETWLTSRLPATTVTFRNLGWSGDTVQGISRAVFGSPEEGFARLMKDVTEAEPTVILVAYGGNEAHEGEAGLSRFRQQLQRLLNELGTATDACLVLLAPRTYEKLASPLPDPTDYNEKLALYVAALRDEATQHQIPLLVLPDNRQTPSPPWTTDGIHLTETAYWHVARQVAETLGYAEAPWEFDFDAKSVMYNGVNVSLQSWESSQYRWQWMLLDRFLPAPFPPEYSSGKRPQHSYGRMRIRGLEPGSYQLLVDDVPAVTADAAQWERGQMLSLRAGHAQVEELRQLIREKNELYFHRHRPQNETYLFLFRKHEQGNNAMEIPQFDPLIAEKEEHIKTLKQPRPGRYELVRVE